jgi:hypothetical protein
MPLMPTIRPTLASKFNGTLRQPASQANTLTAQIILQTPRPPGLIAWMNVQLRFPDILLVIAEWLNSVSLPQRPTSPTSSTHPFLMLLLPWE